VDFLVKIIISWNFFVLFSEPVYVLCTVLRLHNNSLIYSFLKNVLELWWVCPWLAGNLMAWEPGQLWSIHGPLWGRCIGLWGFSVHNTACGQIHAHTHTFTHIHTHTLVHNTHGELRRERLATGRVRPRREWLLGGWG